MTVRIITTIVGILAALIWAAVLELNKNTLAGWILTIAVIALWLLLRGRYRSFAAARGNGVLARIPIPAIVMVAACAAVFALTQPPVKSVHALGGAATQKVKANETLTDPVQVAQGAVQGVVGEDGVEVFAGIPYAKPPVGDLRWREPQDPDAYDGTLIADTFAPMSMQPRRSELYSSLAQIIGYHDYRISLRDNWTAPMSEDSLYLNIWRPAAGSDAAQPEDGMAGLPVLVYIHGGSLQTGQPWYEDYAGTGLAKKGVIVVNMGYRLGTFGFHASKALAEESENGTTGDYGLLDQIKALEWVQENISSFGGDPSNITLAGESAGSACVSALCTSPLAKGLFRRAIAESSSVSAKEPAHSYRAFDEALETGERVEEKLGTHDLKKLREMSAESLVSFADDDHHITVDGYVLPVSPYEAYAAGVHNEEAVLHGFNKDESIPFLIGVDTKLSNYDNILKAAFGDRTEDVKTLYSAKNNADSTQAVRDIDSALWFAYGHYCWTRQALRLDVPVYEYYFTKENGRLSAWHSGEEIYCYGNIPAESKLYDETDRELSDIMSTYWANFAKYGDPNGAGEAKGLTTERKELPRWEASSDPSKVLELGENVAVTDDPHLALYEIIDDVQGWETQK